MKGGTKHPYGHSAPAASSMFSESHRAHKTLADSPTLTGLLTVGFVPHISLVRFWSMRVFVHPSGVLSHLLPVPLLCGFLYRAPGLLEGCTVTIISSQVKQVLTSLITFWHKKHYISSLQNKSKCRGIILLYTVKTCCSYC